MKNRVSIEVILLIMDDIILRRQHECEYSDELHGVFFVHESHVSRWKKHGRFSALFCDDAVWSAAHRALNFHRPEVYFERFMKKSGCSCQTLEFKNELKERTSLGTLFLRHISSLRYPTLPSSTHSRSFSTFSNLPAASFPLGRVLGILICASVFCLSAICTNV